MNNALNRGIGLAFPYTFLPMYDQKLADKFSGKRNWRVGDSLNESGALKEIQDQTTFNLNGSGHMNG